MVKQSQSPLASVGMLVTLPSEWLNLLQVDMECPRCHARWRERGAGALTQVVVIIMAVDPKAYTAYKLAEVTPEMDLNWSRVQATTKALHDLKAAVHELISAESSQTKGAYNLQVKGAARKKMIAKEQRRLTAAWIAVDKLSAES